MSDDYLRIQGFSFSEIELESQNGPLPRHLVEMFVTELFPQSRQVDVKPVRLVFDKTQLTLLRDELLRLELPPLSDQNISSAQ